MARRRQIRRRRNVAPQTREMPRVDISAKQALTRAMDAVDASVSKINAAIYYLNLAGLEHIASGLDDINFNLEAAYNEIEEGV